MATGDAYPFGTLICRLSWENKHHPSVYLGCFPYSFISPATGDVLSVQHGEPVDVIIVIGRIDPILSCRTGWDQRESIETRYHLWNPKTCPAL